MKENDIKWVGRSPFNDTYGFAANGDLAKEEGPFDFDSMAAYLKENPDTTVCMETEFPDRPDGLVLWEEATGYKIPQCADPDPRHRPDLHRDHATASATSVRSSRPTAGSRRSTSSWSRTRAS